MFWSLINHYANENNLNKNSPAQITPHVHYILQYGRLEISRAPRPCTANRGLHT